MVPVCIDFDVVSNDGEFNAVKDMLLHCVPRVGDYVQPVVDMEPLKVLNVYHYCDGTIYVELDKATYSKPSIIEFREAFIEAGCRII